MGGVTCNGFGAEGNAEEQSRAERSHVLSLLPHVIQRSHLCIGVIYTPHLCYVVINTHFYTGVRTSVASS